LGERCKLPSGSRRGYSFVNMHVKLFSSKAFSAQNAANIVQRWAPPGPAGGAFSASNVLGITLPVWTHWMSLQHRQNLQILCNYTHRQVETTSVTTVSECFGLDEWMTGLILQVSAPGLHQLLACDLVQNVVYLVQLHHCTKARYAYESILLLISHVSSRTCQWRWAWSTGWRCMESRPVRPRLGGFDLGRSSLIKFSLSYQLEKCRYAGMA